MNQKKFTAKSTLPNNFFEEFLEAVFDTFKRSVPAKLTPTCITGIPGKAIIESLASVRNFVAQTTTQLQNAMSPSELYQLATPFDNTAVVCCLYEIYTAYTLYRPHNEALLCTKNPLGDHLETCNYHFLEFYVWCVCFLESLSGELFSDVLKRKFNKKLYTLLRDEGEKAIFYNDFFFNALLCSIAK